VFTVRHAAKHGNRTKSPLDKPPREISSPIQIPWIRHWWTLGLCSQTISPWDGTRSPSFSMNVLCKKPYYCTSCPLKTKHTLYNRNQEPEPENPDAAGFRKKPDVNRFPYWWVPDVFSSLDILCGQMRTMTILKSWMQASHIRRAGHEGEAGKDAHGCVRQRETWDHRACKWVLLQAYFMTE